MSLIIRITLVVEGLDVGVVARIHIGNRLVANELLVVVSTHGTSVQEQVGILDSRNNDAEDTDAHTYTLRMDIVDDVGSLKEGVRIDLQLVQLLVDVQEFLVHLCAVSMGEYASDVAHVVVDDVTLDAVTSL